jgi:hypothetical protein
MGILNSLMVQMETILAYAEQFFGQSLIDAKFINKIILFCIYILQIIVRFKIIFHNIRLNCNILIIIQSYAMTINLFYSMS